VMCGTTATGLNSSVPLFMAAAREVVNAHARTHAYQQEAVLFDKEI
jgi:hypothetical protein